MKYRDHARLWRMVEGAVIDALKSHPDYFTPKGNKNAARSVTKRVVGQIVGQAKEALRRGRLGDCSERATDQSSDPLGGSMTAQGGSVANGAPTTPSDPEAP